MNTSTPHATLHQELPRETRRRMTTRLLREAASATGAERDRLIEEVIVANAEVARSIAQRYARRGIPTEDLEQVAYLALVRAAQRFDGDRADDFLTYAVPTIRGEIKRWFRDHGWTVRPPRGVQELQTAVLKERAAAGRTLTAAELAERLGVDESRVDEALKARGCFSPSSLDAPVGEEDGASVGDLLPTADGGVEECETRVMVEQAMRALSPRERLVLKLRFTDDLSQAEVGKAIGVTQAQVSRLLSEITHTLRDELKDTPLAA